MKKTIITLASSLVILPTIALANDYNNNSGIIYHGPVNLSSVSALLSESGIFTEKEVIVEGVLLRQTEKDTYIFSDGKGEIQVELDDDIHLLTPITPETKVRIYGEFEAGSTPEIEAERIQIL